MAVANPPEDIQTEKRILLIGKTGAGKSSTGNTILGFDAFEARHSPSAVTKKIQYNTAERYGKTLVVVDTPGVFDTKMTKAEVHEEIAKLYPIMSPGIHAILLFVKGGRLSEEEQNTVDYFKHIFGDGLHDFVILIFSNKDDLTREGITLDQYLSEMDKNSSLFRLIRGRRNRCISIGYYKEYTEERNTEFRNILSTIEIVCRENGANFFTNSTFKTIEKVMNINEEGRMSVEKVRMEVNADKQLHRGLLFLRSTTRSGIYYNSFAFQPLYVTIKMIVECIVDRAFEFLVMHN